MDTPSSLLKYAVSEANDQKRMHMVIKACKLITDCLPNERKHAILLDQIDMVKYLILAIPILESSTTIILDYLFKKFKNHPKFIKQAIDAIGYIAILEENPMECMNNRKRIVELDHIEKIDYCEEIMTSKENIKLVALDYLEQILNTINKEKEQSSNNELDFLQESNDLIRIYIKRTNSKRVIAKAQYISQRFNLFQIDENINESELIKKSRLQRYYTQILQNEKEEEEEEETTGQIKSDPHHNGIHSIEDIEFRNKYAKARAIQNIQKPEGNKADKKAAKKEKKADKNSNDPSTVDSINTDESSEIDEDDHDENHLIEEWLTSVDYNETPLIIENEYMKMAIKRQEVLENLILYITDPHVFMINPIWSKCFPEIMSLPRKIYDYHDYVAHEGKKVIKLQEKTFIYYMFRSYKAMLVLMHPTNYQYILSLNIRFIEIYFAMINASMKKEDISNCNMNHIANIIDYYLKEETELTIDCIIHSNLLYRLMQNIEFPFVQQLIISIIDYNDDRNERNYTRIIKYCKASGFFDDFAAFMLNGESSIDQKKLSVEYKPLGSEEIFINSKYRNSNMPYPVLKLDVDQIKKSSANDLILVEEINDFKSDIDGIKGYIKPKEGQLVQITKENITSSMNDRNSIDSPGVLSKGYPQKEKVEKSNLGPKGASSISNSKNNRIRQQTRSSLRHNTSLVGKGQSNGPSTKKTLSRQRSFINSPTQDLTQIKKPITESSKSSSQNNNNNNSQVQNIRKSTILNKENNDSSLLQNPIANKISLPKLKTPSRNSTTQYLPSIEPSQDNNNHQVFPSSKSSPIMIIEQCTFAKPSSSKGFLPEMKKIQKNIENTKALVEIKDRNNMKSIPNNTEDLSIAGPIKKIPLSPLPPGQFLVNPSPPSNSLTERLGSKKKPKGSIFESAFNFRERNDDAKLIGLTPTTATSARKIEAQSLSSRFFHDGIISQKKTEKLKGLYPMQASLFIETHIDKESQENRFSPSFLYKNDIYALHCCEVLDILIRKSLINEEEFDFREVFGQPKVDYMMFWEAVFESLTKRFFEKMMKNYLYKIKVHHQMEINSGYLAGNIVNLILQNMTTNQYLKKYTKEIHSISLDFFPFLCKTIIRSHGWSKNHDSKVYLKEHILEEPLGAGRLMLVTTLKLMIDNDSVNEYNVINQIFETCWHTLIIWFNEKRTNSLYANVFYLILQKAFEFGSEKLLITILFKLNLLGNLSMLMNEICVNGVLLKQNNIDSILFSVSRIVNLINNVQKHNTKYPKLIEQLNTSISWKDLQSMPILSKNIS